jgi:hypothetical protein
MAISKKQSGSVQPASCNTTVTITVCRRPRLNNESQLRSDPTSVVLAASQQGIAMHQRSFNKHEYLFEPWHYVPLLKQKPGALRDGAPFAQWVLPSAIMTIKKLYLQRTGGDRDFVELLQLIQTHDMDTVTVACELALESKTTQFAVIMNLINRLTESSSEPLLDVQHYPQLQFLPEANCQRHEKLLTHKRST